MAYFLHCFIICLFSFCHFAVNTEQLKQLTKKYTLRIPFFVPVTGRIPIGPACIESVKLLVDRVNGQSDLLSNYNIILDTFNGKCLGHASVPRLIDFFDKVGIVNDNVAQSLALTSNEVYGEFLVPANVSVTKASAQRSLVSPVVVGGFCGSDCGPVTNIVREFNFINVMGLCQDRHMHHSAYRNSFRYIAFTNAIARANVAMAKYMGWNKVAVISAVDNFSFMMGRLNLENLLLNNITILAEHFFENDPTDALERLRNAGARVIFVSCHFQTCPRIGCAAVRMGYYGKSVVWFFIGTAGFIRKGARLPKGCDRNKIEEISNNSFMAVPNLHVTTLPNETSEIGITLKEVDQLFKNEKINPMAAKFSNRMACFEALQQIIYILDKTERLLNKENETLVDYLAVEGNKLHRRHDEIVEKLKDVATNLNISGLVGRAVLDRKTRNALGREVLISQFRKGAEVPVFLYNLEGEGILKTLSKIKWITPGGKPPVSEPAQREEHPVVPTAAVYTVRVVNGLAVVALVGVFMACVSFRKHKKVVDTFHLFNLVVIMGLILLLLAPMFYPDSQEIGLFCKVAPLLIVMGYSLAMGGLVFKILTPFFFKITRPISTYKRIQAVMMAVFLAWLVANAALLLVLYSNASKLMPSFIEFVQKKVTNDGLAIWQADVITTTIWPKCVIKDDYYIGMAILGLQGFISLVGMMAALISRYHRAETKITDIGATRISIYVGFPISLALLMAMFTLQAYWTKFVLSTVFGLILSCFFVAIHAVFLVKFEEHQANAAAAVAAVQKKMGRKNMTGPGYSFKAPADGNPRQPEDSSQPSFSAYRSSVALE